MPVAAIHRAASRDSSSAERRGVFATLSWISPSGEPALRRMREPGVIQESSSEVRSVAMCARKMRDAHSKGRAGANCVSH